eukprot:jgi/Chrpa1/26162/Chrysochromulina_OHIO_Genome00001145-RA
MKVAATLSLLLASTEAYYFYSLGDWGGSSDTEPTTQVEYNNAAGMVKAAHGLDASKPEFALLVGDNFYGAGIQGNAYSKRFQQTFENVFNISNPELNIPFFAIAGNHDHKGNVTAQIAYTKLSSRWTYDDYWFTKSLTVDGVTTQVVMIDTVTIAGIAYKDDATGEIHSNEPHPMQANWTSQLQWLEETLKSSTADYLWVVGHYPPYSQCEHGPTHKIIREVLPLMSKYKASGYIAGHDHCSGYYFDDNMAFVIAGAGKQCCYEPKNLNNRANPGLPLFRMDAGENKGDGGGFASYTVSATGTQIRFHMASGAVQYEPTVIKPRAKSSMLVEQAA